MKAALLAVALGLASSQAFAITPFSLPWKNAPTSGAQYNTADHPNGVFVLEFYANFCGACNDNATNVNALATAYQSNDRVQVLDMSLDTSEREISIWINKHAPNHPVLKDGNSVVWDQIHENYIPTTVVMDCHGDVQLKHTGVWDDATVQEIHAAVDGLLAQDCK